MNKNTLILFFCFGIFFSACSKKTLNFKDAEIADEFAVNDLEFEYLTTNSKIRFSNDEKNLSATANIRLKKDSIIWVSITPGFGIEAARGIITQDSLIFINRMNKEYSAYDFEQLSREFNFSIDFDLLQSVLLGDMPLEPGDQDLVKKESNYYVVKQEKGAITINNFVDARSLKLERVAMQDRSKEEVFGKSRTRNNTLTLRYNDFQMLNEQVFPFENLVSLDYQRNGKKRRTEIDIQHKKASITDEVLRFPFSVPEKYVQK
ncbi:DUF4292 domain-containing protein [Catalinimonas niigatensis]|uniref:DUF4292 domain-containing protein n=1 Tax=Catalinimonas niigatensis TaxID=1397264 RepID=UPI0026660CFB|nr:DUF4292 domain-containing protein [Catalinimonas niigatensis]WPP49420.1 DUF4292 domain-containing protein [Catalinimonas niigatensis]